MKVVFLYAFIFFSIGILHAQKTDYLFATIADSLKENANAVVRLDQTDIRILSQRNLSVSNKRIVTVLNEKGLGNIDATEYYDKTSSVKSIEATVYDAFGKEIKKIRRKDFRDQCVIDGVTTFSDNRIIYLDYTPVQYPFTIVFESERSTSNTAFIPLWLPMNDYFLSVEKSIVNVTYPENLGFKKKELHFSGFQIQKTADSPTFLSYTATNFIARKQEDYSPQYLDIFPVVMFGLEKFHLEGVDGNASTWQEFGKWYSEKILSDVTKLSESSVAAVKKLVGNENDPIKKAKIVYDFVQKKSRYVSIQVGIGGFKPMQAADVDRLGYGDCKALTNYTKALLDAVDVPSYHTVLYGNRRQRSIDGDFVSMQGDHMILALPSGKEYIFLECTSQDNPFGYQANFTDDRDVLVIKPDGGEIVHTTKYIDKDNRQFSVGKYNVAADGMVSANVAITSEGSQYGTKFPLENNAPTENEKHYKSYWNNINNLKMNKIAFRNDKEKVQFTENVTFDAVNYGSVTAPRMIFPVNLYNQYSANLKRIRNRKTPFEILRGFYDEDEIAIALPDGFAIESIPKNFELSGKFGEYKTELVQTDAHHLVYKRKLWMKKGSFPSDDYETYRNFIDQVARNDNAKIVLLKN
ncbi:hypothetical protein FNO01nite_23570 [Flavobacterium noncentrifugens]|uniref:DUF3857 domain-containing protein n=1 Tax=Flavobacterium noncentrifugens TaxID=1128970 RepID=A0A1G9B2U1_9FLAO|nr:DUF3857 domain-containing protein [Flavobacterium noncentrifugens]GEP51685.1 hypothetical protein FNO01nite_23570 [Flavobacterium noncentrifugens]SDK33842.1 protein of unknown function [Flavobacterium noncentrifugens]